jgi:hypothetical protein
MSYVSECLEKFQSAPTVVREYFGSQEIFTKVKNLESKYSEIDLSFLVILLVIGELYDEDVVEYLQGKYKISLELATSIRNDLLVEIFEQSIFTVKYSDLFDLSKIDNNQERGIYLKIFQEDLVSLLKEDVQIKKFVNTRIFYHFSKDLGLQKQLNDVFLLNQEVFSNKEFILQGRGKASNIANWIIDFTKNKGGGLFSSLDLADFMINSGNIKNLDSEEKELVKSILLLYRNLHFFPESMPNDTGENWEIIPVAVQERHIDKPPMAKRIEPEMPRLDKNKIIQKEGKKEIYFADDVVRFDNTSDVETQDFASKAGGRAQNFEPLHLEPAVPKPLEKKLLAKPEEKLEIEAPEEIEKISAPKKPKLLFAPGDLKEQMQKVLSGDLWQSNQIDTLKEQIHQSDGDDIKKLLNGFQQAKTAEQVVARLEYIAKTGHFKQLLSFIGLKYEELTPDNFVKVIKAFLEKRLDEKEIPRFAMRLAILLKKYGREDYMKAVYFDKKDQRFKWSV